VPQNSDPVDSSVVNTAECRKFTHIMKTMQNFTSYWFHTKQTLKQLQRDTLHTQSFLEHSHTCLPIVV